MLSELKENKDKKLNEIRKTVHEQNKNINKELETIKKNKKNSRAQNIITELNKIVRKCLTADFTGRRNQRTWRQVIWSYLVRGAKEKIKNKEKQKEPKEFMRHYQMDQYMHYGNTRRRREKEKGAENLFEELIAGNSTNLRE